MTDNMIDEIQTRVIDGVTVKSVTGSPSLRQVLAAVESIYSDTVTSDVVWDFSEGSSARLSAEDLQRIVLLVKRRAAARKGGRTAMIAPGDLEYGMGRMLEVFRDLAQIEFEFRVFRSAADASRWLEIDRLPGAG